MVHFYSDMLQSIDATGNKVSLCYNVLSPFLVSPEHLNFDEIRQSYWLQLKTEKETCDSFTDSTRDRFLDPCLPDQTGKYIHNNGECPLINSGSPFDLTCPFEEYDLCKYGLDWIKTMQFFSFYFKTPTAAHSQKILKGFHGNRYIHYYR